MRLLLPFILFLFLSKAVFAQEVKEDSLLTESQNNRWISEFEKITSKALKIEEIKKKIQQDSSYTIQIRRAGSVKIRANSSSSRRSYECKILFALWLKRESIELEPNQYPETNEILDLITETDINEIIVLDSNTTYAIFGSGAINSCGGVIMRSENRKFRKEVKKISSQF